MEGLDLLIEECRACEQTLAGIDPARWAEPALGSWNLAELVAHLVRGVGRVDDYLDVAIAADEPACDRISYWQTDLEAIAPEIAARARAEAAEIDPVTLPERFATTWRRCVERVEAERPDRVLHTLRGPMRLVEFLDTRLLEVVVHHLDVRRALDLPPATTPAAGRAVVRTLEALLDGPRPRNLGRDRFILAATGRIPSDDERFPVLR